MHLDIVLFYCSLATQKVEEMSSGRILYRRIVNASSVLSSGSAGGSSAAATPSTSAGSSAAATPSTSGTLTEAR